MSILQQSQNDLFYLDNVNTYFNEYQFYYNKGFRIKALIKIVNGDTVWRKILTVENIDEFDEFLSIRQHFPHQIFPLMIFCRLPARSLFRAGVIAIIRTHAKFFLSK